MEEKVALIFTGGYCNAERAKKYLPESANLIIAADSGYALASKLGVKPDIALGDFDSYRGVLPEELERMRVPCEKDDTDTMLACEYAIDRGCTKLTIIGGTGGRVDHGISNILYLEDLKLGGIDALLTDGENTVRVIKDETVFVPDEGGYFSIFALDECVVTETGCKYPLDNATLVRRRPYALSNEVVGECAEVTVNGTALLVTSMK